MHTPHARFAIAPVIALTPLHVLAVEVFCVDTVGELDTALTAANDDPVEIRVVRGTCDPTGSRMDLLSTCSGDEDLVIRGGYAPGCGSHTSESADTGGLSGLLVPASASAATAVRIEGLAFSSFSIAAVTLSGGSDHAIQGSQFGGGGTTLTDSSEHGRCIAYDRDPIFDSGFE